MSKSSFQEHQEIIWMVCCVFEGQCFSVAFFPMKFSTHRGLQQEIVVAQKCINKSLKEFLISLYIARKMGDRNVYRQAWKHST